MSQKYLEYWTRNHKHWQYLNFERITRDHQALIQQHTSTISNQAITLHFSYSQSWQLKTLDERELLDVKLTEHNKDAILTSVTSFSLSRLSSQTDSGTTTTCMHFIQDLNNFIHNIEGHDPNKVYICICIMQYQPSNLNKVDNEIIS